MSLFSYILIMDVTYLILFIIISSKDEVNSSVAIGADFEAL